MEDRSICMPVVYIKQKEELGPFLKAMLPVARLSV